MLRDPQSSGGRGRRSEPTVPRSGGQQRGGGRYSGSGSNQGRAIDLLRAGGSKLILYLDPDPNGRQTDKLPSKCMQASAARPAADRPPAP